MNFETDSAIKTMQTVSVNELCFQASSRIVLVLSVNDIDSSRKLEWNISPTNKTVH